MAESVFETVKQSITVREAAQMYGIEVNRSGMACCPFHDVRTKASVTPFPICASCPTRAQAASGMRHDKANVRPFFFSGPIKRHKIRGRNAILTFAHNLIRHHPEQKQARI